MQGVAVYQYAVMALVAVAVAQGGPVASKGGAVALDENVVKVGRFADRVLIDQALASSRPPVPLVREKPERYYVNALAFEPSVVALAEPKLVPVVTAKVEAPRPATTREQRFLALAVNGSTEFAVTATP